MLKIKVKPQDFIVEEIAELPLVKNGRFGVYFLKKEGWNTLELLLELSRELNIPFRSFSYGGRKDRHALTSQYITIEGEKVKEIKHNNYSLEFVGFMERPMGPDLIRENKFQVVVRKLSSKEAEKAVSEIKNIHHSGYPNYFDDQRFGSLDKGQGFLAEKLLKQQFNGAFKIYITSFYSQDKKETVDKKRFFFEHWKDWFACKERARTTFEKKAFDYLLTKPGGFLDLLKQIPEYELKLFISAYQSYLWNEILRQAIKAKVGGPLKSYSGIAGDYIFYNDLEENKYNYFNNLTIPVPGPKVKIEDKLISGIYSQVLEGDCIKTAMFNKLKLRQAFFKSFDRHAIVKPRDLRFEIKNDEIYPSSKKLELKFFLSRGSFATMLIKRIFV